LGALCPFYKTHPWKKGQSAFFRLKQYLNTAGEKPFGFQLQAVQILIDGYATFNSATKRTLLEADTHQAVESLSTVVVGIGIRDWHLLK